jgi:Icc protein
MQRVSLLLLSLAAALVLVGLAIAPASIAAETFHFALLGDRTGEVQAGVYEEAWREAAAENPAFILSVGDTIQGLDDRTIDAEWQEVAEIWKPYRRFKLFLTPGNHDVWDTASAQAYEKYSHHPLHYSFDWQQAHFTILDDSETDNLRPEELEFLERDLAAHAAQTVKFIVSHRPAWLFAAVLGDSKLPLHQLALKYGVKCIIAGHIHQMLRFQLGAVTYLCLASSGGHLRNDKAYQHGWFFQHTQVNVAGQDVHFRIEELSAPFGKGRVTTPDDWGAAGLAQPQSHR